MLRDSCGCQVPLEARKAALVEGMHLEDIAVAGAHSDGLGTSVVAVGSTWSSRRKGDLRMGGLEV